MAKPAGAIEPSDGGLQAVDTADINSANRAYVIARVPLQPPHWQTYSDGDERYQYTVARQHTIAAGETLYDRWLFRGQYGAQELSEISTPGAVNAAWLNRDDPTSAVVGYSCDAPALSPGADTLPRYTRLIISARKEGATNAEILGVYLEQSQDSDYADPDPAGAQPVERTDRTTIRLYDADRPISSWLMQCCYCHAMNKIEYEARQIWSVPL